MKTATKALLNAGGVLILLGSASVYAWVFRSIRSDKAYIMDGNSMAPTLSLGDRVMGDNRPNSFDSRMIGTVPLAKVQAVAVDAGPGISDSQ